MRAVDIIEKSTMVSNFRRQEIEYFVRVYERRDPDYQAAAWGSGAVERRRRNHFPTLAMANSGEKLD